ncbi:MAG: hypothetical protein WDZ35_15085 [Crocinitomicaceae bacterium]
MKAFFYITFSLACIALTACKGSAEDADVSDTDTLQVDTTAIDSSLVDTTAFTDDSGYVDEALETENIIEATYGKQWDFCDCVVKNDSVNKAIETAGDDEFDAILERMDEIDKHCKKMLTTPNTTPEERAKHDRKVRKCLKNAK